MVSDYRWYMDSSVIPFLELVMSLNNQELKYQMFVILI